MNIKNNHIPGNVWQKQLENCIETADALRSYIYLSPDEKLAIEKASSSYPFAITPHVAGLMERDDPSCPIRRQMIPDMREWDGTGGFPDPLKEGEHSPVPGVVQVYPDRVAVIVTGKCATRCRFCLRRWMLTEPDLEGERLDRVICYLSENVEIRDVLLTGGDPFMLDDEVIENFLVKLRAIPHIEIIRFGTRTTSTLPYRITDDLAGMITQFHPVWVNTQFNHPKEVNEESARAVDCLLGYGIPVGNQSVLLKGVNDDPCVMLELVRKLVKIRVRPYYLYQAQNLKGTEHFIVPIEQGLKLLKKLRGYTTGFAVPQYVLDTPYGKVPLNNLYHEGREGDYFIMKSYCGNTWREYNPTDRGKISPEIISQFTHISS